MKTKKYIINQNQKSKLATNALQGTWLVTNSNNDVTVNIQKG